MPLTEYAAGKSLEDCQDEMVRELEELYKDMRFYSRSEKKRVGLKIYAQSLPIPPRNRAQDEQEYAGIDYCEEMEEDPVLKCPWCIVRVSSGKMPEPEGKCQMEMTVQFGIYNADNDNQGHRELMSLIWRFYGRFAADPLLAKKYNCTGEFDWALQDEDTYPHFFGAVATTFEFTGYRRESKFT